MGSRTSVTVRELVICSMLTAILLISKAVLSFLPNIELISFFCILYTLYFGKKALLIIGCFIAVEGLAFGFGMWWFGYLIAWPLLWAISMSLRKIRSVLLWTVVSGAFGLLFGMLCAIPYLFVGGLSAAASYWLAGIPFDLTHCFGNCVVMALLYHPMRRLFDRCFPAHA